MSELKERIPDEVSLKVHIASRSAEVLTAVRAAAGNDEAAYLRSVRQQRWGYLYLCIGFVALFIYNPLVLFIPLFDSTPFWVAWPVAFLLAALALYGGYRLLMWFGVQRFIQLRFHAAVNRAVFREAFALLGLPGTWNENVILQMTSAYDRQPGPGNAVVLGRLEASELITEDHNTNLVDDEFSVLVGDREVQIAELDIKHVTGSGKNRHTKHIFHGYLVGMPLRRPLVGKTFVSTDGDTSGVGHQTFWNEVLGGEAKETQLEWNEFENLLHVATTDGAEARYILSTDFMHDLYEWWKEKPGNIRLSFIGQSFYILFPDDQVRLHDSVPRLNEQSLTDYLYTITKPLMHVVHLIEDVKV